ncbi:esterase [Leadbetterella sp. DM7]|uniref:esterase n=1 Tax=Leadbetterella sp. DM7 TaxID=3235085 RepID=UPI00349EDB17
MKKTFLVLSILIVSVFTLKAQQNLDFSGAQGIISPVVNNNNTVTFKLDAPKAAEVFIQGDWMPSQGWVPGKAAMSKDEKGIWTYTSEALKSDLFMYNFIVDGLKITDPNNVYQIRDIANIFSIFITNGNQSSLYKVEDVPHGTVSRTWYDSPRLKATRRLTVYTPPGYEQTKESYPVLYLLHGVGGDEEAWISLGRTAQILDNLIAAGKAKPMLVVMTNGHTSNAAAPGESSKGLYKPVMMTPDVGSGNMESTFQDVVDFVEKTYRVKKNKADRAIAGLSMGGSHTLFISAYLNNTFDYVGLFSAAYRLGRPDVKEIPAVYENYEKNLEKQRDNGYRLYWIGMGKTDFLYQSGADFRKLLDDKKAKYTYRESEGGHTWSNWRLYLSEFAPLLFK